MNAAPAFAQPRPISLIGWVRIVTRVLAMIALLIACLPLYYVWRVLRLHNPWPRLFLAAVTAMAGVETRIEGVPVRRGAFLLANHVSWIDIPALAGITGTAYVGHDGLASMPILRWLCELNDTVFIARHDRASVHRQSQQVREALSETGALAIFPEGTTGDGTGLLPFKSSLLSALDPLPPGIAVQPVVLDYGDEAAGVAWIGEEHGLDNFRRILARGRPVRVVVRFLPPLGGEALKDRKSIAFAAREAIAAAL